MGTSSPAALPLGEDILEYRCDMQMIVQTTYQIMYLLKLYHKCICSLYIYNYTECSGMGLCIIGYTSGNGFVHTCASVICLS